MMSYLKHLIRDKSVLFNKAIPLLNKYVSDIEINSNSNFKSLIIAVGDIHGSFLQTLIPLIITKFIKNVKITESSINFNYVDNPDLSNKIIYLGDIFDRAYHDKYYLITDLLIKLITKYPDNIIWCYGNHDVDKYIELSEETNLTNEEERFYNFSFINLKTIYYEPLNNVMFSHTLILNKNYQSILTGDLEDLLLFSSYSSRSEYSEYKTNSIESKSESKFDEIEEFNNNVRFLLNQKEIRERINCKCFNNRYEDLNELSKIFKINNKHIVGHDVTNLDEYICEENKNIIFCDFEAMYKKNAFNTYYIERPKFIFIENNEIKINKYPSLTIK